MSHCSMRSMIVCVAFEWRSPVSPRRTGRRAAGTGCTGPIGRRTPRGRSVRPSPCRSGHRGGPRCRRGLSRTPSPSGSARWDGHSQRGPSMALITRGAAWPLSVTLVPSFPAYGLDGAWDAADHSFGGGVVDRAHRTALDALEHQPALLQRRAVHDPFVGVGTEGGNPISMAPPERSPEESFRQLPDGEGQHLGPQPLSGLLVPPDRPTHCAPVRPVIRRVGSTPAPCPPIAHRWAPPVEWPTIHLGTHRYQEFRSPEIHSWTERDGP